MREVVGDRSVNEVLTVGRQEIADEVEVRLQELCNQYETGIKVDQVVLQDVNPPDPVKPSFNEVNQAQQEREKMINEARSAVQPRHSPRPRRGAADDPAGRRATPPTASTAPRETPRCSTPC